MSFFTQKNPFSSVKLEGFYFYKLLLLTCIIFEITIKYISNAAVENFFKKLFRFLIINESKKQEK